MRGTTHLLTGILTGLLLPTSNKLFTISMTVIGALLPDIDKTGSTISNNLPLGKTISRIAERMLTHRGITHALWTPLLLGIVSIQLSATAHITTPLALGILTHTLLDALTPAGVKLFYPFSVLRAKGTIPTGSWKENILFALLLLANSTYFFLSS